MIFSHCHCLRTILVAWTARASHRTVTRTEKICVWKKNHRKSHTKRPWHKYTTLSMFQLYGPEKGRRSAAARERERSRKLKMWAIWCDTAAESEEGGAAEMKFEWHELECKKSFPIDRSRVRARSMTLRFGRVSLHGKELLHSVSLCVLLLPHAANVLDNLNRRRKTIFFRATNDLCVVSCDCMWLDG